MGDNRNFLIAILLSLLVFAGWQYFVLEPQMEAERARQEAAAQSEVADDTTKAQEVPGDVRLPNVEEPPNSAK